MLCLVAALRVPLRHSAVALAFSGAAWAVAAPLHPPIFQGDVAGLVRGTDAWELIHILAMAGSLAAIFGLAGIVAAHEGTMGRSGDAILGVTIGGAVLMAAIMLSEALMWPTLAVRDPHLLELDGPLLGLVGVRVVVALSGAYPIGVVLLGALASRADLAPAAGLALVVGTVTFGVFAFRFVPVLGVIAAGAFAGVHVWWAWVLWNHEGHSRRPAARMG